MKLIKSDDYWVLSVSRFAVSFEKNHPLYEKRFGLRVLTPFHTHGCGLHLGKFLLHFHPNRQK